jgi:hypothetical protein
MVEITLSVIPNTILFGLNEMISAANFSTNLINRVSFSVASVTLALLS